jgi:hypothetical protein
MHHVPRILYPPSSQLMRTAGLVGDGPEQQARYCSKTIPAAAHQPVLKVAARSSRECCTRARSLHHYRETVRADAVPRCVAHGTSFVPCWFCMASACPRVGCDASHKAAACSHQIAAATASISFLDPANEPFGGVV